MADNVVLDAGTGGDTIAADDVAGVKYQLVQIVHGTDGGSKTLANHLGAGAVGAAVPRTTLCSDDPAVAALQIMDDWDDGSDHCEVVGAAAHDAAVAGAPILVGAYAKATAPSDVSADADAVRLWSLLNGSLVVNLASGGTLLTNTGNSLNVNVTNSFSLAGDVAHDAADSGNPVKIGGRVVTTLSGIAAAAHDDRTNAIFDDIGRQVVVSGQVRDLMTHQATTITSSTSETTVLTAVASTFLDITLVVIANKSATATLVTFKDSTAGTIRFVVYVPAGQTIGFAPPRPVTQAAVNNNWTATCGSSVDSVYIFVQAEKNI